MTDFVHWYPLQEAAARAPTCAGVFQVRIVNGLLDYPSGKSAMVHYASAQNLQNAISQVAQDHSDGDFLCRHQSSEQPAVLLAFVFSQFERRFGTPPSWPCPSP